MVATTHRMNFPKLEQSPPIVSTDLPIKEYLYHNPPNLPTDNSFDVLVCLAKDNLASNITAADTGTTNADAAIVDVFVEKDPERGQKRKTAVIEGRRCAIIYYVSPFVKMIFRVQE